MTGVMCHVSGVKCHLHGSGVICQMSGVMCHQPIVRKGTDRATYCLLVRYHVSLDTLDRCHVSHVKCQVSTVSCQIPDAQFIDSSLNFLANTFFCSSAYYGDL